MDGMILVSWPRRRRSYASECEREVLAYLKIDINWRRRINRWRGISVAGGGGVYARPCRQIRRRVFVAGNASRVMASIKKQPPRNSVAAARAVFLKSIGAHGSICGYWLHSMYMREIIFHMALANITPPILLNAAW